jgi:hypothetical protein
MNIKASEECKITKCAVVNCVFSKLEHAPPFLFDNRPTDQNPIISGKHFKQSDRVSSIKTTNKPVVRAQHFNGFRNNKVKTDMLMRTISQPGVIILHDTYKHMKSNWHG